jgi:hypothetical protein
MRFQHQISPFGKKIQSFSKCSVVVCIPQEAATAQSSPTYVDERGVAKWTV